MQRSIVALKSSLQCVHVTFCDAPHTVMSKMQPHAEYSTIIAQNITGGHQTIHTAPATEHPYDPYITQPVTQYPANTLPISSGAQYTGEFLLTLTQREVKDGLGCSSHFVYPYCTQLPQQYHNFGGNFWAEIEGNYVIARPEFQVTYTGIDPEPGSSGAPVASSGGGSSHAWPSSSGSVLLHPAQPVAPFGVFSEMPQLHVLGAEALALGPSANASAPAEAELLPKKKRMKALKFFDAGADVSTDGSGRAAE